LVTLLLTLGFSSCSKEDISMLVGEGTAIISGIVSDKGTGAPLKEIKIIYEAYDLRGRLIDTKTSYSSGEGIYTIEATGYTSAINCTLTASGTDNGYSESRIELSIDWNGPSYNSAEGSFVVNDCNFFLTKSAMR
jgi:hypothetical protein